MEPISKEYLLLFNAITDTLASLDQLRRQLLEAQQQAEALYIAGETAPSDAGSV